MSRRLISIASLAVAWVMLSQSTASAVISKYIDGPRDERGIAVAAGVHAWSVDTAAHPGVYNVWAAPDGEAPYRVSDPANTALVGSIDPANPTFGDVLVFSSSAGHGTPDYNIRFWDLANRRALVPPDAIDTTTADEKDPSISGDYLLFKRQQRSSGAQRLLLYRFSTQTFTSITSESPTQNVSIVDAHLTGDYLVWNTCSEATFVCNVFRRRISTSTTVESPNAGHANHWATVMADGTVYYVEGSPRFCGHRTKLMKWTGSGSATMLAQLPEGIDGGPTDAYNDGTSTTLYFTRTRCSAGLPTGIYRLPNV